MAVANNTINLVLKTIATGSGIGKIVAQAKSLISGLGRIASAGRAAFGKLGSAAASVGRNLVNIQAGVHMLASAVRTIVGNMAKAFRFETMTVQFKTLVGSMAEAKEHMAMLQKMGETPPFSMEQFAAASRQMMIMSDGALGYRQSLELVGDAAAATGTPIETLAHEVGRAYAVIRDGQPIERATMSLRNMGVITPEVAARMKEMQKAGKTNAEIWAELEKAISRYSGAMKETEQTGEGLMGAIQSQWDNAIRDFGASFMDVAKGGMSRVLEKMKDLRADGSIQVWADKAAKAVGSVAGSISTAIGWLGKLKKAYDWVRDGAERVGSAVGAYVGTLVGGGSMKDASEASRREWNQTKKEQADRKAEAKKMDEEIRAQTRAKHKAEAEKAAKDEAQAKAKESQRITKQLAEAQAKANIAAMIKAYEESRKKELEKEKSANTDRANDLREKLKRAQADAAAAFEGWGQRGDIDNGGARRSERQRNIDRERIQKAAIDLQEKRPDWRNARNLSRQDEAARRFLLAKENEQKAGNELKDVVGKLDKIEKLLEAATTL